MIIIEKEIYKCDHKITMFAVATKDENKYSKYCSLTYEAYLTEWFSKKEEAVEILRKIIIKE